MTVRFETPSAFLVRDEFDQSAGNLTAKTLPVGGTWTAVSGSDADDFTLDTTNHWAQRTALNDTGAISGDIASGRALDAGTTNYGNVCVQVDLSAVLLSAASNSMWFYARRSATGVVTVKVTPRSTGMSVLEFLVLDGSGANYTFAVGAVDMSAARWVTMRLVVLNGYAHLWCFPQGGRPGKPLLTLAHEQLATGGGVTSGKIGILDSWISGTSGDTRRYDNFLAFTPTPDAAIFA